MVRLVRNFALNFPRDQSNYDRYFTWVLCTPNTRRFGNYVLHVLSVCNSCEFLNFTIIQFVCTVKRRIIYASCRPFSAKLQLLSRAHGAMERHSLPSITLRIPSGM